MYAGLSPLVALQKKFYSVKAEEEAARDVSMRIMPRVSRTC